MTNAISLGLSLWSGISSGGWCDAQSGQLAEVPGCACVARLVAAEERHGGVIAGGLSCGGDSSSMYNDKDTIREE